MNDDKCLVREQLSAKIKNIVFCTQQDLLSIGLQNGYLISYTIKVSPCIHKNGSDEH